MNIIYSIKLFSSTRDTRDKTNALLSYLPSDYEKIVLYLNH